MTTRKEFLKQSALFAGSALLFPSLRKNMLRHSKYKPGLQLYTVRDAMKLDPQNTLEQVAQIGYKEVEGATYTGSELYYGMHVNAFSKILEDNGLTMPSSHYSLGAAVVDGRHPRGTIMNDWEHAVDDAVKMGQKYMVCAYLPDQFRKSIDDYKKVAEQFNKAGEVCKKAGIQFCYHNHNFEFPKIDGQVPYEVLLNSTDKELVKMEMDIYWITKAGFDPLAMFKEHPGRFVLWHVKDMDNTSRHFFTEVGNGIIDFKKIFAHADEAGMQHFFVEQDICPGSPFVSIKESLTWLEKNILT